MVELHEREGEFVLEAGDAEGREIKFHLLLEIAVRRVVAAQHGERAVGESRENRVAVPRGAERRIHFEIGVERRPRGTPRGVGFVAENAPAILRPERLAAGDRGVGEREVMRAGLAGNGHAALLGLAQQADAAGGAYMLAVDGRASEFGEEDVALHDHFLAHGGPAAQSELGAPVALVHDALGGELVILAMIHRGQVEHARVFERAAHEVVVLHAMAVVGDRDDAGLEKLSDGREFLARDALGDRAGDEDVHRIFLLRFFAQQRDDGGTVDRGRRVRHANDGSETAFRRGLDAGGDGLFRGLAGFAQMHVEINQTGANNLAARVETLDLRGRGRRGVRPDGGDAAVEDKHVRGGVEVVGGVDDATAGEQQGTHAARTIQLRELTTQAPSLSSARSRA